MRGSYTIHTEGGLQIPLRFTALAFSNFSEKNKLSYSGLFDLLTSGEMTAKHMLSLLLCGAEYVCLKENKQFHYTELDASEWIDDMGGLFSSKVMDVMKVAIDALVPQQEEATGEGAKNGQAST